MKAKYLVGVFVLAFIIQSNCYAGCCKGMGRMLSSRVSDAADDTNSDMPTGTEQITFVELGSVNCIPCKKMQPIMEEIEQEYTGKVKVVFYDVWTKEGKKHGNQYGVRLIPTQVFLDKEGNEIARHEGFFPKDEIEKVFEENGVTK